MNEKVKIISALILILLLSTIIIRAEEKVSVSQVTMEETIEIIQADPKLAVEFYKFLAQTYTRAKRYEEAAEVYQKALEITPKDESLHLALARLYSWQIKDPQKATLEYEKLIEINPEKSEYYTRLAKLYLQMGMKEKAIPFLERVAKVRPDDAYVHSKLGKLYQYCRMYPEAIQAYQEAIRLKPEETKFRLELAQAYQEYGKYEKALKEYLGVIKVAKSEKERNLIDEWTAENIGLYDVWEIILVRAEYLGMLPRLTRKFKKKVARDSGNPILRKDLARIYIRKGEYEKAVIQCLEAIRLNPEDNVAWYRLGRAYERKKDFIPAIRAYLEIIVKDLGMKRLSRGLTLDKRGHWAALNMINEITGKRALYSEAIEEVEKAIKRNPTQVDLYWLLAYLYQKKGDYAQAIKAYQDVMRLAPHRKATIYHQIGDIYVKEKKYKKAIASYEKIFTLSQPASPRHQRIEALKRIFLVYEKMGQVEEKLREYEERIAREPDNIELYQKLGKIYEVLNRREKGSRLYLKALEIAPQNREIKRGARTLAWKCKGSGALKAALPFYQRFSEQEPSRTQYIVALIEIYTGLGEKEKAHSLLQEIIRREPKSSYDLGNIARLYQQQGEYALAEEWYRKAREIADSPWYRSQYSFKLVRFSLAEGNYEKAEELLKEAIRLTPSQPAPYLGLAELYRKEGKYRKAKALYKEILKRTEKNWTEDYIIEEIHEALLEVKEKSILRAFAQEYEKKLERDPKNIDLRNYLTQIYKKIEKSQKEIEPVEEPLSLGDYGYHEFVEEIE